MGIFGGFLNGSFKQLQRLEEDNSRLEQQNNQLHALVNSQHADVSYEELSEQIRSLQEENRSLKSGAPDNRDVCSSCGTDMSGNKFCTRCGTKAEERSVVGLNPKYDELSELQSKYQELKSNYTGREDANLEESNKVIQGLMSKLDAKNSFSYDNPRDRFKSIIDNLLGGKPAPVLMSELNKDDSKFVTQSVIEFYRGSGQLNPTPEERVDDNTKGDYLNEVVTIGLRRIGYFVEDIDGFEDEGVDLKIWDGIPNAPGSVLVAEMQNKNWKWTIPLPRRNDHGEKDDPTNGLYIRHLKKTTETVLRDQGSDTKKNGEPLLIALTTTFLNRDSFFYPSAGKSGLEQLNFIFIGRLRLIALLRGLFPELRDHLNVRVEEPEKCSRGACRGLMADFRDPETMKPKKICTEYCHRQDMKNKIENWSI